MILCEIKMNENVFVALRLKSSFAKIEFVASVFVYKNNGLCFFLNNLVRDATYTFLTIFFKK